MNEGQAAAMMGLLQPSGDGLPSRAQIELLPAIIEQWTVGIIGGLDDTGQFGPSCIIDLKYPGLVVFQISGAPGSRGG